MLGEDEAARLKPLPRARSTQGRCSTSREACVGKLWSTTRPRVSPSAGIVEILEAYCARRADLAASTVARGGPRASRRGVRAARARLRLFHLRDALGVQHRRRQAKVRPHAVLVRAPRAARRDRASWPRAARSTLAWREAARARERSWKLCAALGIDRRHYGADLCEGPLFLADGPLGPDASAALLAGSTSTYGRRMGEPPLSLLRTREAPDLDSALATEARPVGARASTDPRYFLRKVRPAGAGLRKCQAGSPTNGLLAFRAGCGR